MGALEGILDEFLGRFPKRFSRGIAEIDEKTSPQLDELLKPLSSEELQHLLETIRTRRSLVRSAPAYGNEVVAISKQVLAFGGAGIGLAAAFAQKLADIPQGILYVVGTLGLFYFNLILLSLFVIFAFVWQARSRYPFLYFEKIGNAAPFFYYQAVSPDTPREIFQTARQKFDGARLYAEDIVKFFTLYTSTRVSSPKSSDWESKARLFVEVRHELQQYFLILAYQGYVNQYEVRMNNYFLCGLVAAIVVAPLTVGVIAILDTILR